MPEYTTNFNLEKPLQNEYFDIDIQNGNMDIIDNEFKKVNIQIDELASNEIGKGASKIGIHDADSNFTATDVEGALSELFTNVSNGKQQIATAITDVDSSLSPSGSDTFTQLGSMIRSINTGQKYALGSFTITSVTFSGNTGLGSINQIIINDLDFKPSFVVVYGGSTRDNPLILSTFNNEEDVVSRGASEQVSVTYNGSPATIYVKLWDIYDNSFITNNGFTIRTKNSSFGGSGYPYQTFDVNVPYTYEAWE